MMERREEFENEFENIQCQYDDFERYFKRANLSKTRVACFVRSNSGNEAAAAAEHQRGVAYTLLTTSNKKDANFAASLAEAFDREGREVSPELAALCHKSNRYGGGRVKHSKDGLGFEGVGAGANGASAGMARTSYYGPSSIGQPEKKRVDGVEGPLVLQI